MSMCTHHALNVPHQETDRRIQIVDTGVANIASLHAMFRRLGYRSNLVDRPVEIERAERLVLPGVGSFGAAMQRLQELDLVACLRERIEAERATFAVCLGLQLLCRASEESPGISGLSVVPHIVERFSNNVQVPQLGWNDVEFKDDRLIENGHAYFANSFRLKHQPDGWQVAVTDYDGEFVSAMWRGNVLACQFHPELSGAWGERLVSHWLTGTGHA
ncbi:MAG TPA: imidazole glycerol phosphate synthase subunit HisH [Pirellulaceae bacterium]|nr:imidazole glycerol phosphate synthase subunit HisH [Pirellulaceae bacterium]HMO92381.1 imidazole glycerol phosphate synthase subunit HisH [Pirellulaceae bacterium]HMP70756.1 imidazole glycerol phosphate synthase subunit HisH [Pirellulaceae bacterium]